MSDAGAAFLLSLRLSVWTTLLLVPVGFMLGRLLAFTDLKGRQWLEAILLLPLLLPPTVLGFYLLLVLSPQNPVGAMLAQLLGQPLVFSFSGLVLASMLVNLPFAVFPVQQAFHAIPDDVREAAQVCGMSSWRTLWRIDIPLAWRGTVAAVMLVFAHTMGEFGVVLMVGGNIAGETRTASIAIYDSVQAFDMQSAVWLTLALIAVSISSLLIVRLAGAQARGYLSHLP